MLLEYKHIIEKRTGLIQKKLKWDTGFSTAIRKSGILDSHTVHEIEAEPQDESRAYHLAKTLQEQSGPEVFNQFCSLLVKTGHSDIAKVLMADRDSVQWDFQRAGFSANSVAFLSVMEDQLIRRMDTEEDSHIRDCIWKEVCVRLAKLKVDLREEQHNRDRFRKSLLSVCSKVGLESVPRRKISASKLLSQNAEIEEENFVLKKVKATIESLQNELLKFQRAFEAGNDPSRTDTADNLNQCADLNSEKSKVEMLSKLIKDQDIKIMWLQEDMKMREEHNFIIKKGDVIAMLDFMLSRQENRVCNAHDDIVDEDIPETVIGHTTALFNLIDEGEDKIKKLKKRLNQIGDRVAELEMEREVIMKMFGIKPSTKKSLQDAAGARLKQHEQTEKDLEAELESLRKRIGTLGEENRCLAQKIEGSVDSPTPLMPQSAQSVKAGAARRSSAPPVRHLTKPESSGATSSPKNGRRRRTSVVTQH